MNEFFQCLERIEQAILTGDSRVALAASNELENLPLARLSLDPIVTQIGVISHVQQWAADLARVQPIALPANKLRALRTVRYSKHIVSKLHRKEGIDQNELTEMMNPSRKIAHAVSSGNVRGVTRITDWAEEELRWIESPRSVQGEEAIASLRKWIESNDNARQEMKAEVDIAIDGLKQLLDL